jgi:3-(3-hydroxy-phenyl)propionate hydroxylase
MPTSAPTLAGKRVFELLRAARPVLLDLSRTAGLAGAAAGWAGRIGIVAADCPSQVWEVPSAAGAGTNPAPPALLIRPDGHVAWVDDRDPDLAALHEALGTWCGPAPTPALDIRAAVGLGCWPAQTAGITGGS